MCVEVEAAGAGPSLTLSQGAQKDTLANVLRAGELVVNASTHPIRSDVNHCSVELGPGESEIKDGTSLELEPSTLVQVACMHWWRAGFEADSLMVGSSRAPVALGAGVQAALDASSGQAGSAGFCHPGHR